MAVSRNASRDGLAGVGDGDSARKAGFVGPGVAADVAVLVVTYNNAAHIDHLLGSLREEARHHRLRVIVADNCSTDGTLARTQRHADVLAFTTGGNLGYAAGINLAARCAGDAGALLVLNPDLRVGAGAIAAMRARLSQPGVGAVVPRICDADGRTFPSLRREPNAWRVVGDAVLGNHLPHRPPWSTETIHDAASYGHPHPVDWATGAALLVDARAAAEVGDWDERFFLYSEETDFFRRVRAGGRAVWYEPAAVVHHAQGGSGGSDELLALLAVNRIRYIEKHCSPTQALVARAAMAMWASLRATSPAHRSAFRYLLRKDRWDELPSSSRDRRESSASPASQPQRAEEQAHPDPGAVVRPRAGTGNRSWGSVVIPAHDEASVIGRTLRPLADLARTGHLEVLVACNGCSDDTAEVARTFRGVTVLETPFTSKTAALNAADAVALTWPRLYLDADIQVSAHALRDVFRTLDAGEVLAARPPFVYDTTQSRTIVRAYYRARTRLPSTTSALWGAGAYALSEEGHARLRRFPAVTGDDLYVDALFEPAEKRVIDASPVVVRTPRDTRSLLAVLRRVRRGNAELLSDQREGVAVRRTATATFGELLRSVRGPSSAIDAAVYASVALVVRASRSTTGRWERDDSSRV